jgi:hypothetical protein
VKKQNVMLGLTNSKLGLKELNIHVFRPKHVRECSSSIVYKVLKVETAQVSICR